MSSKTHARSECFAALSLREFHSEQLLKSWNDEKDILSSPGLYPITSRSRQKSYVGGTLNLRNRLSTQFAEGQLDEWETRWSAKSIWLLRKPEVTDPIELLSMQRRLIELERPSLNDLGPTAA
jgi:excinuclease UvrABC nuclease subunit